jgi:putative polymerase
MQAASAKTLDAMSHAGARLVLAAVTFNLALCFISTRGNLHISNTEVAGIEIMILAAGLYFCRHLVSGQEMRISGLVVLFLIGLKFINPALDLKILHDLGITYIFYELGMLTSVGQGGRVLWIVMAIVIAVAAFEVLLPIKFGMVFDVWSYYVDKGVITADTINYANTTSFISGARGGQEARSFLPSILGAQRFSSVFLEPVSMGNFSVITFAWCLSTKSGDWRWRALLVACAGACFVLADSRFAAACWVLMLLFRITPLHRSRFVIFCLPLLAMLALLVNGSLHEMPGVVPAIVNDDFAGRLLFSGQLLNSWGFTQWLALAPSAVYTSDTGYAYVINNLGLPLAILLLGGFAFHKPATPEGLAMKAMITIYMATSLCIGANMFTIKTAALCWFLYGAANSGAAPIKNIARTRLSRRLAPAPSLG